MKTQNYRRGTASASLITTALAVPLMPSAPVSGQIYQANAAQISGAHYSEPLTGYSNGIVDDSGIDEALEFIAPRTPAGRKFEYKTEEAKADFQYDAEDAREIGEDFKTMQIVKEMVLGKTLNRGLTAVIDEDDHDDSENPEEEAVERIIRRLKRNELIRAIALLDAAAVNTGRVWSTAAGKNPEADLRASLMAGADASGRLATNLLFSELAWNTRVSSHEAQNTAGGFAAADRSVDEVATKIRATRGLINSSRYDNDGVLTNILGSAVYSYTALPGATRKDSSNIKRFVTTIGGQQFRVHRIQISAKVVHVTVEHYSQTYITSTLGIRKETVSDA